jgi:hypothetical protein
MPTAGIPRRWHVCSTEMIVKIAVVRQLTTQQLSLSALLTQMFALPKLFVFSCGAFGSVAYPNSAGQHGPG